MLAHFHFPEISSTQDKTFELFEQNIQPPFIVTADLQTSGRGRMQRAWTGETGRSLFMSLGISLKPARLLGLTSMLGICIHQALAVDGLKVKWPNDLMLEDLKVGGILVESKSRGSESIVSIGVGLNLFNLQSAPYKGLQKKIDAEFLAKKILESVSIFERFGFSQFKEVYEEFMWKLNQTVKLRIDGVETEIRVEGVSDDGLLKIESGGQLSLTDQGEIVYE